METALSRTVGDRTIPDSLDGQIGFAAMIIGMKGEYTHCVKYQTLDQGKLNVNFLYSVMYIVGPEKK